MSLTLSVPMAQELVDEAIKIGNLSNPKQIEKIFAGEQTHLLFKSQEGASFYENLLLNGWTDTELTECINEILMSFASIYADVFSVLYTRESPIKNLGRLSGGAGADNIIPYNNALSVPEFRGLSFEQLHDHPRFRRCSPKAKVLLLMCALAAEQTAASSDSLVAVAGGAAGVAFGGTGVFMALGGIGAILAPSLIPGAAVVTGLVLVSGICGISSCKARSNALDVGASRQNRLRAAKLKLDIDYKNNGTRKNGKDVGVDKFLVAFMEASVEENMAELEAMHSKNAALALGALKTGVAIAAPITAAQAAVRGAEFRGKLRGIAVLATAFVSPAAALAAAPGAALGAYADYANAQHGVQTAQMTGLQAAATHVLGLGAEGAFKPLTNIPTEQRRQAVMARQTLARLARLDAEAAAAPAALAQPAAVANAAPASLRQRAVAAAQALRQGAAAVGQRVADAAEGALEPPPAPKGGAAPSMAMTPFINNRIVSTFDNMRIPANICSFLLMLTAADIHPEILMRIAIILAGPVGADSRGGSPKVGRASLRRRRVKKSTRRRVAKK